MSQQPTLRQELLFRFGVLFGFAVLFALFGIVVLDLPGIESPTRRTLIILVLFCTEFAALFVLGSAVIRRLMVAPMEQLAADAGRIASGDFRYRIQESNSRELHQVRTSVNEMADRLITDQELLAENVESLEHTVRDLIEARDQVIHTARLASVGTLAAGVAHEIGNPLGAIMAFVDVAKGRMEKSGEDPELLEYIRGEAARIDRIVRGLLDYARPRDDTVAPYSPVDVLNRVRELLESQGKLDDLDAEWASLGDVPNVVMERHRLEQVMVNLLLNAVAALESTENARISVDVWGEAGGVSLLPVKREHDPVGISYVHRRRVSQEDGGHGIDLIFNADRVAVIRVSDNGPGIPEEDRESVFDPFFTTKELGKGTGLGLSICARLVEGMGGRIHADNQEGGGAAFTIRLPGASEKPDELGAEPQ